MTTETILPTTHAISATDTGVATAMPAMALPVNDASAKVTNPTTLGATPVMQNMTNTPTGVQLEKPAVIAPKKEATITFTEKELEDLMLQTIITYEAQKAGKEAAQEAAKATNKDLHSGNIAAQLAQQAMGNRAPETVPTKARPTTPASIIAATQQDVSHTETVTTRANAAQTVHVKC
ncbi:MAG: hypothetical protein P8P30_05700 [Rickettsiales bacterium]|nr:hypothetical protein [Rickettsiales bacterium]